MVLSPGVMLGVHIHQASVFQFLQAIRNNRG